VNILTKPWAVRGVPDELITELRDHARRQRLTMGEAVTEAIRGYLAAAQIGESVTVNDRLVALEEAVAQLKKGR